MKCGERYYLISPYYYDHLDVSGYVAEAQLAMKGKIMEYTLSKKPVSQHRNLKVPKEVETVSEAVNFKINPHMIK